MLPGEKVQFIVVAPFTRNRPAVVAGAGGGRTLPGGIDGEVTPFGREFSGTFGSFLSIVALKAAGEFGDKTQLVTVALAAQYGTTSAIWVGKMLVVPASLTNAHLFHRSSRRLDLRTAYLMGAALFAFFGLDTLLAAATGFSVWETVVGAVSAAVVTLR